jgi:hypothetical protein
MIKLEVEQAQLEYGGPDRIQCTAFRPLHCVHYCKRVHCM